MSVHGRYAEVENVDNCRVEDGAAEDVNEQVERDVLVPCLWWAAGCGAACRGDWCSLWRWTSRTSGCHDHELFMKQREEKYAAA